MQIRLDLYMTPVSTNSRLWVSGMRMTTHEACAWEAVRYLESTIASNRYIVTKSVIKSNMPVYPHSNMSQLVVPESGRMLVRTIQTSKRVTVEPR